MGERERYFVSSLSQCVHMCVNVCICVCLRFCVRLRHDDGVYVCDCVMMMVYTCAIASWLPADPGHIFCLSVCVYSWGGEGGDQQAFWHHSWRFRKTWPPLAALLPRSMRMHQSCYAQQSVMLRATMSHVTCNNQSCYVQQSVPPHTSRSQVTHIINIFWHHNYVHICAK